MRPSLSGMPANPEAMPVANGLIVEPSVPDAAAEQHDGGPGERVVAGGDDHGDDQGVERQALLRHPEGRAANREA